MQPIIKPAPRMCEAENCLGRVRWVPKLCVPPKGYPPDSGKHCSVICGIHLCEDHMRVLTPDQLINDATYNAVMAFTKGKADPNWPLTFILPVEITSSEYRMWDSQRRKGLLI